MKEDAGVKDAYVRRQTYLSGERQDEQDEVRFKDVRDGGRPGGRSNGSAARVLGRNLLSKTLGRCGRREEIRRPKTRTRRARRKDLQAGRQKTRWCARCPTFFEWDNAMLFRRAVDGGKELVQACATTNDHRKESGPGGEEDARKHTSGAKRGELRHQTLRKIDAIRPRSWREALSFVLVPIYVFPSYVKVTAI